MKFVEFIANHIYEGSVPLERLLVIVPSRRMKKYLYTALFERYGKPIIAPTILTMDQWVRESCPLSIVDSTRSLIELYRIHKEIVPKEESSFEEFLNWGTTLLSDINEIDRYLLESKQVFRNLADIKEIENWSFGAEQLSENQKKFLEFWDRLPGYYEGLNEKLESSSSCTSGRAYRMLAEDISLVFPDKNQHFLFAGFNALSKAELSLMKQLQRMGRAEILIDSDNYYLKDRHHEAGQFLRELQKELDNKNLHRQLDNLSNKEMELNIVQCPQYTGQVKMASTVLQSLGKEELDDSLLLLADEALVVPMLKNLPAEIQRANISLGLPIRNTAVKTWIDLLFKVQENRRRFGTSAMYFKDVETFWQHPFVQSILDLEERISALNLEQNIIKGNRIFVNQSTMHLGEISKSLVELICEPWNEDYQKAISSIRQLNRIIYRRLNRENAFEKAIVQSLDEGLVEFQNIVDEGLPKMNLSSFRQLFNKHWNQLSIAYHGNPTGGLQIMGLLETRGLDFKNIICLGLNEGNLPPTNALQSLIPMDLRRFLGLPTQREKQGLFAHHFYRLLHSSERLWVSYLTKDNGIGSVEPSRYLTQLKLELDRDNKGVQINESVYSLNDEIRQESYPVKKSEEILDRLDTAFAKSTSASMLKKYITCPLDFYYRYVMDFGESAEIEEEIEHSTFGTFIHETLEALYTPFARFDDKGNEVSPRPAKLTSAHVDGFLKDFKVVLTSKFKKYFNEDEMAFKTGKNLLSYRMAQELTERFLKSEKAFIERVGPIQIEALELKITHEMEIDVHGEKKKIKLNGYIDRIDKVGEQVRIIDYKSGSVKPDDVRFRAKDTELEDIYESLKGRKHLMQLLMYAYMYKCENKVEASSSIISFITGKGEPFELSARSMSMEELIDLFPKCLELLFEEIYNSEIDFNHEGGYISYCKYC